jgi:hypothetical protein
LGIYRGAGGTGDAVADSSSEALLVRNLSIEVQADADAAAASATTAANSASAASTSASNALTAENNAETAQTAAELAETNAETAQAAAEAAQLAAETAKTAAETAETNAETAETNAETAASLSQAWATQLVTPVSGSDYSAKYNANLAAASASAAQTAETNAETAQSAAESARDATLAAYDSFDDRYLGAKSSAPTLDNDGNALVGGALYFDTVSQGMKVYTGSVWVDAYVPGSTYLAKANNLSDLNNVSTARTNLGLGTIATQAANSVSITGGSVSGITDLAIADGGTGASDAATARTNLGLVIGTNVQAYSAQLQSYATNGVAMKNRIINGAMVIDQRNAGASVTPAASAYTLDRWQAALTQTSKFTVQQNAGAVTPPVGFTKYLGVTSSSAYSITSTDYFNIVQQIEGFNTADLGWGTADAKTVTLSFQVRSSLTGTFGGSLSNINVNRSYPFSYSIPVANTWTTISVTIAGDTTGTWATDNSTGIRLWFGLGVGSTFSGTAGSWAGADYRSATGATSVVATSGATFYITGVQLEVGSSATGFEYRQYTTELQLCQRYYERIGFGDASSRYPTTGSIASSSGQPAVASIAFAVTKRTIPTLVDGTISLTSASSASSDGATVNGFRFAATSNTTGFFSGTYLTSGVTASAEL